MASCSGHCHLSQADFGLRIFNPDGSEAEKSGNGLRIFARYLWDSGRVEKQHEPGGRQSSLPFSILTPGGKVWAQVLENGELVRVEMGQAVFDSASIPVTGPARQVVNETLQVGGEELHFCAVSLGNPHCVVLYPEANSAGRPPAWPIDRKSPTFSTPHERPVPGGRRPAEPAH